VHHRQQLHEDIPDGPPAPDPRRWAALALICLAEFMLVLDVTAANVALPSIGAELSLGRAALTWVLTAYVLTFGGLMLLGGRLADTLGRRRMLLAGLVVFTASSLASGLADSGAVLIGGRAFQGVGAALLSPAALSLITTTFTGAERNRALGVWAAIGASGFVVGLLMSGALTAGPGWAWVFLINVPVGLVVLAALPSAVPPDEPRAGAARLDVGGAMLVTASTALLVYGLTAAGDAGWTAPGTLLPIAAAVVAGAAFVALERRLANPLMRIDLLAHRPVVSGTLIMLAASALMLSMFFLVSIYLQDVLGYDALRTGLAFLPAAIAVTVGAHGGAHLVGRVGARAVAVAAFAFTAVGASLLTRLSADSDLWSGLVPGLVIIAIGLGPAFVVATSTALASVDQHEAGLASGIVNTGHEVGGAVGVAAMSTLAAGSFADGAGSPAGIAGAFAVMAIVAGGVALAAVFVVPRGPRGAAAVAHPH
jgi:EmrB/QacA subfamily drug resistance transporter